MIQIIKINLNEQIQVQYILQIKRIPLKNKKKIKTIILIIVGINLDSEQKADI